ncbi:MAG: hypothetical protein U1D25_13285, partial [Hydrogenophaga sp.]|uniref:hypothetical protein n=1 Tax=Hydrogenophaga sp. TaxID=1904254 RepID=UPI002AB8A859
DLSAAFEVTFFKIQLSDSLKRWQHNQQADAMVNEMATLIQKGSLPPFQADVKDHMTDVVTSMLSPADVKKLSEAFLSIARQTGSSELSCFSGYIRGQNCLVRESIPDVNSSSTNNVRPVDAKKVRDSRVPLVPTDDTDNALELTKDAALSSAAAVEVARINQLPNKAVLFSYDESTGQLSRETESLGGLTFTAKSLGSVGSGRFQLQVSPSKSSPVKLSKGRYRTKVALLLDYVREDRCTAGALRCLVNQKVTHSKILNKVVYFDVGPYNAYTSSSAASFGSLMPLSTGGSGLYESQLKSTRLSIKSVELEMTYRGD